MVTRAPAPGQRAPRWRVGGERTGQIVAAADRHATVLRGRAGFVRAAQRRPRKAGARTRDETTQSRRSPADCAGFARRSPQAAPALRMHERRRGACTCPPRPRASATAPPSRAPPNSLGLMTSGSRATKFLYFSGAWRVAPNFVLRADRSEFRETQETSFLRGERGGEPGGLHKPEQFIRRRAHPRLQQTPRTLAMVCAACAVCASHPKRLSHRPPDARFRETRSTVRAPGRRRNATRVHLSARHDRPPFPAPLGHDCPVWAPRQRRQDGTGRLSPPATHGQGHEWPWWASRGELESKQRCTRYRLCQPRRGHPPGHPPHFAPSVSQTRYNASATVSARAMTPGARARTLAATLERLPPDGVCACLSRSFSAMIEELLPSSSSS